MASFELFVDLLFVGVLEVNGEFAAEHATAESLLRFSIAFILSWKIWTDFTLLISWFETGTKPLRRRPVPLWFLTTPLTSGMQMISSSGSRCSSAWPVSLVIRLT